MAQIQHTTVRVENYSLGVRTAGSVERPAFVFLHGWPESGRCYEPLMHLLAEEFFLLAVDLPGVGASTGAMHAGDKAGLARIVREVVRHSRARFVILVGHDVGGMVAYSYLRKFGTELRGAAILNTVIPGIPPWEKVTANPNIWHFAFHAVPNLPENIVGGRQGRYFDYFFDLLSFEKSAITPEMRAQLVGDYARPEALTSGFNWYRAFTEDAKQNEGEALVNTPVLYVRGECESGNIDEYVTGLRQSGCRNTAGELIPNCGHFSPLEAPLPLAELLRNFRVTATTVSGLRSRGMRKSALATDKRAHSFFNSHR